MYNSPDFISLGLLSFDINDYGDGTYLKNPGGAVAYSSKLASDHQMNPGIVTSCGKDYDIEILLPDTKTIIYPSENTTTFMNTYNLEERNQALLLHSNKIPQQIIPKEWKKPKIFFAGPVLHEIPKDSINWFQADFSYIVPQGWFRRWSDDGIIEIISHMANNEFNKKWDLMVLSEEESKNLSKELLLGWAKIICITKSSDGANIFCDNGDEFNISAIKVPDVVDPTGAGDIWAAAMAIKLYSGSSIIEAGNYASAAAALSIESYGFCNSFRSSEIINKISKID
ncbi:MAG: hypothetical protein CL778_00990 [Chloroflexi bacterium]|nr:hypothetical protein [Chloroflexota bacterium]